MRLSYDELLGTWEVEEDPKAGDDARVEVVWRLPYTVAAFKQLFSVFKGPDGKVSLMLQIPAYVIRGPEIRG